MLRLSIPLFRPALGAFAVVSALTVALPMGALAQPAAPQTAVAATVNGVAIPTQTVNAAVVNFKTKSLRICVLASKALLINPR